jgi:FAD:protein FMN transferase
MRMVRTVMGMPVTVDVRDRAAGQDVLDHVFADLAFVDRLFSPFIAESAVSRINRRELRPEVAHPLVGKVLELCRLYEIATGGYFSAWIEGRLDPSGLVKGWAIDRACAILEGHGSRHYFVDAAGDVRTRVWGPAAPAWRVGIRHPLQRDRVTRVLLARDLAIATSGTYEKGAHVNDPHTGRPATEWLSFTVVGPDILEADVYATAALAMGKRGIHFMEALPRFEAYAIGPDLRATWTSGFSALCDPEEAASAGPIIRLSGAARPRSGWIPPVAADRRPRRGR